MRIISIYKNYSNKIKILKDNTFIEAIQKSITCNACNGKGEIINKGSSKENKSKAILCPSCRGVGFISYNYF